MVRYMNKQEKTKNCLIVAFLVVLIAVSLLAIYALNQNGIQTKANPDVYVGIAFGGNTTAEAKQLIDRAKAYTNLFILASGRNPISANQSRVEEICDYAVAQDLNVIINVGINDFSPDVNGWFWQQTTFDDILQRWTERWGDSFLGMYYNDEPGGIQLDGNWTDWFLQYGEDINNMGHAATDSLYNIYNKLLDAMENGSKPQDYDLEAAFFIKHIIREDPGLTALKRTGIKTFTSDYGLFWFDYLGGYDVMFTELGWNNSIAQQIAQIKGAARLQNKEWGAIVTWKYNRPPYLDSGAEIYKQMILAYEAGAKYITIFNYPQLDGNDFGIMKDNHFIALEKLWKTITQQTTTDQSQPEAVLVLPKNYGWGMRHPNDTIWGFWPADDKVLQVGSVMSNLLAKYDVRLDIVYDDPVFPVAKVNYKNIYYWNSTQV